MTTRSNQDAHTFGMQAYANGISQFENPYDQTDSRYYYWQRGWRYAKDELAERTRK